MRSVFCNRTSSLRKKKLYREKVCTYTCSAAILAAENSFQVLFTEAGLL